MSVVGFIIVLRDPGDDGRVTAAISGGCLAAGSTRMTMIVSVRLPAAEAKRKANLVRAGIGIGIGSAAIAAALLYANSARKKKPD